MVYIPPAPAWRAALSGHFDGECVISSYSLGSHGYAQIGWHLDGERHMTTAHRAAWVYSAGEQIPDGMTVDHICRNRQCVNPAHLRLLSNFENARRTHGKDWPLGECINGHSNSMLVKWGSRWRCRECARQQAIRRRRRKRERAL